MVATAGQGEGEVWFLEAAVPDRWEYVAISETSDGLARMQRHELRAAGKLPAEYVPFGGEWPQDYSKLENMKDVAHRRWEVVTCCEPRTGPLKLHVRGADYDTTYRCGFR